MKQLIKKIKEVEDARFSIASKKPEALEILRNTYHLAFGEYYTENCSPCHEKAYFKLMQILNNPNNYQEMSNRKYLLKKGHQVSIFGGNVFTNDNLTDEEAIELLKDNPKRATSFELIDGNPAEDWDGKFGKVSKAKKEPKTDTKVLTQADFDEDPSLTEQGFKVGDTVEVTEE